MVSFTILPAGLSLDTSTGEISGTPTAVTSSATYTITASNTGGSDTATVTIELMTWHHLQFRTVQIPLL